MYPTNNVAGSIGSPSAFSSTGDSESLSIRANRHPRDLARTLEGYAVPYPQANTKAAAGSYINVGPDDTVWSLAGCRLSTGATAHQLVAAMVKANPDAFEPAPGFIDNKRLKADVSRLFLPTLDEILAISDEEAGDISTTIRPGEQSLRRLGPEDQELIFGDDTLELIANRFDVEYATRSQKMVAIFNANPKAFKGGNMHAPKAVEVITMPTAKDVLAIDDKSAKRMIADHQSRYTQEMTSGNRV